MLLRPNMYSPGLTCPIGMNFFHSLLYIFLEKTLMQRKVVFYLFFCDNKSQCTTYTKMPICVLVIKACTYTRPEVFVNTGKIK